MGGAFEMIVVGETSFISGLANMVSPMIPRIISSGSSLTLAMRELDGMNSMMIGAGMCTSLIR